MTGPIIPCYPPPALHPAENRLFGVPGLAACLQDWAIPMRGRTLHMLEHAWAAWRAVAQHGRAPAAAAKSRFLRRYAKIAICGQPCSSLRVSKAVSRRRPIPYASVIERMPRGGRRRGIGVRLLGCQSRRFCDCALGPTRHSESRSLSPVSTLGWCAYMTSRAM